MTTSLRANRGTLELKIKFKLGKLMTLNLAKEH